MYFSSLNFVRSTMAGKDRGSSSSSSLPQLSPLANLLAGAATRAGIGYLIMPVTVIKVRYESSLYNYTSLASASRDIFATEGIRGFFGGWGATAIRDAPYAGLYVLFYEQAKKSLSGLYDGGKGMDDNMAMVVNAAAGAGAAAAATAVTNPFDALKTRIQVNPEKYRNMWTAAKIVCTEEAGRRWRGRALFDGLGLRVARKAVSSALAWGLYERMVR
jgi:solute carrier family 25 protein 38